MRDLDLDLVSPSRGASLNVDRTMSASCSLVGACGLSIEGPASRLLFRGILASIVVIVGGRIIEPI